MTDELPTASSEQPVPDSQSASQNSAPNAIVPEPIDTSPPASSDTPYVPAVEPVITETPLTDQPGTTPELPVINPGPSSIPAPTLPPTNSANETPPKQPLPHAAINSIDIKALLPIANAARATHKAKRLEKILHFVEIHTKISNNQVQMFLRVSDKTATRYLRELTNAGKLRKIGLGTSSTTHYILP